MKKLLLGLGGLATAALLATTPATAQGTVKIGVIAAFSGQFADTSAQIDNGIKLYMKQHGDTVAGKKIEIIRRDTGGPNPDVAKRLAQELSRARRRRHPCRLRADAEGACRCRRVGRSEEVHGHHERRDFDHHHQVGVCHAHLDDAAEVGQTLGQWAVKNGIKKAYTMVSDFGPGHDAEQSFQNAFKAAGGEIVGSVRMPVANPDFSAFVQRAKDLNPESIFVFVPGGAQPAALGKAFAERGIDPNKIKIMSTGEPVDEQALKSMGDIAIGRISAWHYDYNLNNPVNKAFVAAFNAEFKRNPDFFAVGGYDGMHLIYEALKKTGGKTDGPSLIAAAKGLKWTSPRGPMMIDPETRDVVETIYIRRVQKVGNNLVNVEFDKIDNVKDPVKAAMKK